MKILPYESVDTWNGIAYLLQFCVLMRAIAIARTLTFSICARRSLLTFRRRDYVWCLSSFYFFFAVLVVPRLFSFFSLDLLSFNHYSPEWYRLKSFEIFYTLIKMPAMNWEHFGFICDDHYYSIGMLIHIYIDILGNNHESFFCCASFWCCLFSLRWFV